VDADHNIISRNACPTSLSGYNRAVHAEFINQSQFYLFGHQQGQLSFQLIQ
jgi:hypothetical protein